MPIKRSQILGLALASVPLLALPGLAKAADITANPLCKSETAIFAPDNGRDITPPQGFQASLFAAGLNMPTGIAFSRQQEPV